MSSKLEIRTAYKRMAKILILAGKYNMQRQKIREVCRQFADFENVKLDTTKKLWHLKFILERFNDPESAVYKGKILPTLKLTDSKIRRRCKKGTKHDSRKEEYLKYIKSNKWINFRNSIKAKRGNKCEKCGAQNTELHGHHLTYERFMNELETDIQILCKTCHNNIHKKHKNKWKQ